MFFKRPESNVYRPKRNSKRFKPNLAPPNNNRNNNIYSKRNQNSRNERNKEYDNRGYRPQQNPTSMIDILARSINLFSQGGRENQNRRPTRQNPRHRKSIRQNNNNSASVGLTPPARLI